MTTRIVCTILSYRLFKCFLKLKTFLFLTYVSCKLRPNPLIQNQSLIQRCQLVKTLSKAHPPRRPPPSKPAILQTNEIQYIRDLEQVVRREQQLANAEGEGVSVESIKRSGQRRELIGTLEETMATDSLEKCLWKPSRKPGSWVKTGWC